MLLTMISAFNLNMMENWQGYEPMLNLKKKKHRKTKTKNAHHLRPNEEIARIKRSVCVLGVPHILVWKWKSANTKYAIKTMLKVLRKHKHKHHEIGL